MAADLELSTDEVQHVLDVHRCEEVPRAWVEKLCRDYLKLRQTRVALIRGGLDWADASADLLMIPHGLDLGTAHAEWREWFDANRKTPGWKCVHFVEYLVQERGCTYTSDDVVDFHEYD